MENGTLIESSESLMRLENEFIAFANEIGKDEIFLGNVSLFREDLRAYFRELSYHSKGLNLPEGWVPHTTYWYLSPNEEIVGLSDLRHSLSENLKDLGGHIGFIIRPKFRLQGHATKLLALTLQKAHEIGIERILVTTDLDNVGSRKAIEKNGGYFSGEYMSKIAKKVKSRYWIDIKNIA